MPRTPKDFGAFNAPDVDNRIALQKWADCKDHLLLLDTFYYTSETFLFGDDKLFQGVGVNSCGILAHPTMPLGNHLLANKTQSTDLIVDSYTTFTKMTLGGAQLTNEKRQNYCLNVIGFKAFTLEEVMFRDWAFAPFRGINLVRPKLKELDFVRVGAQQDGAQRIIDVTIR